MKRECVVEHKGKFYQLYSFKGIYLHPRIGKRINSKRVMYKDPTFSMCSYIGLKLGLSSKEISYLIEECRKKDDIV